MTKRSNRGFSLLELLTVVAIMGMLSTLAVTSYFSAIRGMTRRSAIKHLVNTLVLARQRSCMEGSRMSVLIFNEVTGYDSRNKAIIAPSYVVCKEVGRVSAKQGDQIYDEFTALDKLFGYEKSVSAIKNDGEYASMRLYNLAEGKWTCVYPKVLLTKDINAIISDGESVNLPIFTFVKNARSESKNPSSATWEVGDPYGIEVTPLNSLPRGFWFKKFEDAENRAPICITFEPDGNASRTENIVIEEQLVSKRTTIKVTNTGEIEYNEKWN
ncbi:MAG: prepilin-type N-terminal cleavage/methylation domain-containing protein [Kiritimatiellae bacterium]|nr:prepilin-type N-terminal cleavage/methylation domain-containing protein [Kiritimatiellia bacterium]